MTCSQASAVCRSRQCSVAFASTGAIITTRVADHAVGRLFLLIGLLLAIGLLAYQYAAYGLTRPGGVPAMTIGAWLSNLVSQPSAALIGLSLMLFPDGRLSSTRWRRAAALSWMAVALLSVPSFLERGSIPAPFESLSNPLDIDGVREATIVAGMLGLGAGGRRDGSRRDVAGDPPAPLAW